MSDFNWCHGPNCHTKETQSRVRGSGDNKVLRTIKIKQGRYNYSGRPELITYADYFCNQSCLMDFIRTHLTTVIAIAPRREPLETPIKVEKTKSQEYRHQWSNGESRRVPYTSTTTTINLK